MKQKPITPYNRLLAEIKELTSKISYAHKRIMWRYPKAKLSEGWGLDNLNERVQAADQLGYDVLLISTDLGLEVHYRKRIEIPYHMKY